MPPLCINWGGKSTGECGEKVLANHDLPMYEWVAIVKR